MDDKTAYAYLHDLVLHLRACTEHASADSAEALTILVGGFDREHLDVSDRTRTAVISEVIELIETKADHLDPPILAPSPPTP